MDSHFLILISYDLVIYWMDSILRLWARVWSYCRLFLRITSMDSITPFQHITSMISCTSEGITLRWSIWLNVMWLNVRWYDDLMHPRSDMIDKASHTEVNDWMFDVFKWMIHALPLCDIMLVESISLLIWSMHMRMHHVMAVIEWNVWMCIVISCSSPNNVNARIGWIEWDIIDDTWWLMIDRNWLS